MLKIILNRVRFYVPMVGANCASLETTVEIRASVGERGLYFDGFVVGKIEVVPEVVCG